MPLLDFLNHSNMPKEGNKEGPNVTALPYHDKINNESFVLLKALRDIKKDEQLLVSYGKLSNSHLLQKYGFTTADNPNNSVSMQLPYHDYQAIVNEELELKVKIRQRLGFSPSLVN